MKQLVNSLNLIVIIMKVLTIVGIKLMIVGIALIHVGNSASVLGFLIQLTTQIVLMIVKKPI